MTDVFSKAKRSDVMSRIRGKGNRDTELEFMKLLRRHRISGWRRHLPILLRRPEAARSNATTQSRRVSPDFVFPRLKVAIFVDGCFWHGCREHGTQPASNAAFWQTKISRNRSRDRYVTAALRRQEWVVLRFWEHQLRESARVVARLRVGLNHGLTKGSPQNSSGHRFTPTSPARG